MKRLLFFTVLISSCGVSKISDKKKYELIKGTWQISKKSSAQPYYEIVFENNYVIFNTTGDTILTYEYQFVPKNLLELKDRNHEIYLVKIKGLDYNKLVIGNLFEDTTKQIYFRKK